MSASFGGRACLDPDALRRECADRDWPTSAWEGRANAARNPAGRTPGTVAALMSGGDARALGPGPHTFTLGDDAGRTFTYAGLTVTRAVQVLPGADGDDSAVYLVEASDCRLLLARKLTDRAFNVRGPDGAYVAATLKTPSGGGAAAPYTWQQVLDALWGDLPAPPNASPAIPAGSPAPDGVPEQFEFYAAPAWHAWNDVAERVGCVAVLDAAAGTIGLRRAGGTRSDPSAGRTWAAAPVLAARAALPETVAVRFARLPAPEPGNSPWYVVRVSTPGAPAGTVAGTEVALDDELPALGATGTPSNSSALSARAAARAADYARAVLGYAGGDLVAWGGCDPAAAAALGVWAGESAAADRGAGPQSEAASGEWAPKGVAPPAKAVLPDLSCYVKFEDLPCSWPVGCDADGNPVMFDLAVPAGCDPCQAVTPPPVPPSPPSPPPVPPSPPSPPPVPPSPPPPPPPTTPPQCRVFASGWYTISRSGVDTECYHYAGGADPSNPGDCTSPPVTVAWTGEPGLIAVRGGPYATQAACSGASSVDPHQTVAYTAPGYYALNYAGDYGAAPFARLVSGPDFASAYVLRDGPFTHAWMAGPSRFSPLAPPQPDAAAQESYLAAHQAGGPQ